MADGAAWARSETLYRLDPEAHAHALVEGLPHADEQLARHLARARYAESVQASSGRLAALTARGLVDVEETLTPGVLAARASARLLRLARTLSWS